MSHQPERLGGQAFNHNQSADAEAEYDRLRDAARRERGQYQHFAAEARQAYDRGDGAGASAASKKSKEHAAKSDQLNQQASEFIFRENNAVGKVQADTIDLHGQFVEEAETIVEQRIEYARQSGQTHLHIIVGKGNHSPGHIQKIKPKVEEICREKGLSYHTEQNEGRIYVDLTGGNAQAPPPGSFQYKPQDYDQSSYGQPHYQTAYPMGQQPQYGTTGATDGFDFEEAAKQAKKYFPIVRKIVRSCCVVM